MTLPKLPKLPRVKKVTEGLPRTQRTASALPALPSAADAPREPGEDEVTPARHVTSDETAVGRWFDLADNPTGTKLGGRCCQCGGLKKAASLRYAVGPFMRWEGWACGPCRNERKGVEGSKQAREGKATKAPNIVKPIPFTEYEKAVHWMRATGRIEPEIVTWNGEGGASWSE